MIRRIEDESNREWRTRAACSGQTKLFYSEDPVDERASKEICRTCPVRHECQTYAVENKEYWGTWGGMTEKERVKVQRKRRLFSEEEDDRRW